MRNEYFELMKNSVKVIDAKELFEIETSDRHHSTRFYGFGKCETSDFPMEGILEVITEMVAETTEKERQKKTKIYAATVCINGEMRLLCKKEGEKLTPYLFNAEFISRGNWFMDRYGELVTDVVGVPKQSDLAVKEESRWEKFDSKRHKVSNEYAGADTINSENVIYEVYRYYRTKEGSVA